MITASIAAIGSLVTIGAIVVWNFGTLVSKLSLLIMEVVFVRPRLLASGTVVL